MYLLSIKDVVIDEYFLLEYHKCQLRAFLFSKKNYVISYNDISQKKSKRFRMKQYIPYGDSLKYKILKNIYYKAFSIIKNGINFQQFKNIAIVVIQKEIESNKRKAKNRSQSYYDKIQKKIFEELEKHFEIINEFDMSNSIDSFITLKANLRTYLQFRQNSINPIYTPNIIKIDWDKVEGDPFFLLNFINIKKDNYGLSIVMTSPFNIEDDLVHRNFYISFIIQYVYYFYPKDKLIEVFGTDKVNIDKLIVYYPLKKERKEYSFQNINGVFQETEMIRILRIFLEKLYIRTNDTKECKHCENKDYCYHRTNACNSTANSFIFQNTNKKIKTII